MIEIDEPHWEGVNRVVSTNVTPEMMITAKRISLMATMIVSDLLTIEIEQINSGRQQYGHAD